MPKPSSKPRSFKSNSFKFARKKRVNPDISEINYKNIELLKDYVDGSGKILGRKNNGLCAKKQRAIQKAIKQARILGLMPFVSA